MRILHLTQTPVAQDPRILKELEALKGLPSAEVIAFGAPAEGPPPVELAGVDIRQFDVVSAKAHRTPRPLRYFLVLGEINVKFLIGALQAGPDVVHCHDTMVLPAGVFTKVLGRAKRLVYDAHELESAKGSQSRVLSTATLLIERLAWSSVDAFISVSPSIVNWYHRQFDRAQHLKPALCLVNSPKFGEPRRSLETTSERNLRTDVGISDEDLLFVYVGALAGGRGIDLILQTIARSTTDAHVAFVGYGPLEDRIREFSRENSNIHLCEPIEHDALVPYIRDADGAFCLIEDVSLSDRYCLPNKFFEYAFAGIPIVASKLPDISNLVTRYKLGACVDMNEASLAEVIKEWTTDQAQHQPRDIRSFSWESQGENLRRFYLELASQAE